MIIPKTYLDPDGWEFEVALYKARYIYPTPDNPYANTIEKHAIQIYESELLERSLCFSQETLKPLTYVNVQRYYACMSMQQALLKTRSPYTIEKHKRITESKVVAEYIYEFNDIFSTNTLKIIECKTYKDSSGRRRQLDKIRNQRKMHICDYYLLARDKNDKEFEMTDFISLRSSNADFVNEEFLDNI